MPNEIEVLSDGAWAAMNKLLVKTRKTEPEEAMDKSNAPTSPRH
jgi:hypothetical protein